MELIAGDAITYLSDDILLKVDRASMAVELETRVPFIDHSVAAVAARVPPSTKVAGEQGKVILKTLTYSQLADPAVRPAQGRLHGPDWSSHRSILSSYFRNGSKADLSRKCPQWVESGH